jgi:hypothetical protein
LIFFKRRVLHHYDDELSYHKQTIHPLRPGVYHLLTSPKGVGLLLLLHTHTLTLELLGTLRKFIRPAPAALVAFGPCSPQQQIRVMANKKNSGYTPSTHYQILQL